MILFVIIIRYSSHSSVSEKYLMGPCRSVCLAFSLRGWINCMIGVHCCATMETTVEQEWDRRSHSCKTLLRKTRQRLLSEFLVPQQLLWITLVQEWSKAQQWPRIILVQQLPWDVAWRRPLKCQFAPKSTPFHPYCSRMIFPFECHWFCLFSFYRNVMKHRNNFTFLHFSLWCFRTSKYVGLIGK